MLQDAERSFRAERLMNRKYKKMSPIEKLVTDLTSLGSLAASDHAYAMDSLKDAARKASAGKAAHLGKKDQKILDDFDAVLRQALTAGSASPYQPAECPRATSPGGAKRYTRTETTSSQDWAGFVRELEASLVQKHALQDKPPKSPPPRRRRPPGAGGYEEVS